MTSFYIRDLLAATAVIALTIATPNLAVAHREHGIVTFAFALAIPLPITVLLQRRFVLDWRIATGIHYPIAIVWAFGFGVAYSFAWRRVPQTFFNRDSVALNYPLQFRVFSMDVMAIAGLASTAFDALVSWSLHQRANSKNRHTGE